jgi:hypothetical protein
VRDATDKRGRGLFTIILSPGRGCWLNLRLSQDRIYTIQEGPQDRSKWDSGLGAFDSRGMQRSDPVLPSSICSLGFDNGVKSAVEISVQNSPGGGCGQACHLLNQYTAVLAFHDQRVRSLSEAASLEEYLNCRRAYERVHSDLVAARKGYWGHVASHNCRTQIGSF